MAGERQAPSVLKPDQGTAGSDASWVGDRWIIRSCLEFSSGAEYCRSRSLPGIRKRRPLTLPHLVVVLRRGRSNPGPMVRVGASRTRSPHGPRISRRADPRPILHTAWQDLRRLRTGDRRCWSGSVSPLQQINHLLTGIRPLVWDVALMARHGAGDRRPGRSGPLFAQVEAPVTTMNESIIQPARRTGGLSGRAGLRSRCIRRTSLSSVSRANTPTSSRRRSACRSSISPHRSGANTSARKRSASTGGSALGVYLGVAPLFGAAGGATFREPPRAEIVDHAVLMRRLPAERMMDVLLGRRCRYGRMPCGRWPPAWSPSIGPSRCPGIPPMPGGPATGSASSRSPITTRPSPSVGDGLRPPACTGCSEK